MTDTFWFRYWPDKMMAQTTGMTLAQKGAYHRLLELAWSRQTCSIPRDAGFIKRRLGVSDLEYESIIEPILHDFWDAEAGELVNPWLREERINAEDRRHKARMAANKRYRGDNVETLKTKGKV